MDARSMYRPAQFLLIAFTVTWLFWFADAYLSSHGCKEGLQGLLMFPGLCGPFIAAVVMFRRAGSQALWSDYRDRLFSPSARPTPQPPQAPPRLRPPRRTLHRHPHPPFSVVYRRKNGTRARRGRPFVREPSAPLPFAGACWGLGSAAPTLPYPVIPLRRKIADLYSKHCWFLEKHCHFPEKMSNPGTIRDRISVTRKQGPGLPLHSRPPCSLSAPRPTLLPPGTYQHHLRPLHSRPPTPPPPYPDLGRSHRCTAAGLVLRIESLT